jgi:hypothetical protein
LGLNPVDGQGKSRWLYSQTQQSEQDHHNFDPGRILISNLPMVWSVDQLARLVCAHEQRAANAQKAETSVGFFGRLWLRWLTSEITTSWLGQFSHFAVVVLTKAAGGRLRKDIRDTSSSVWVELSLLTHTGLRNSFPPPNSPTLYFKWGK